MPKYHRRDIQQMAEKYTLQSKMTEENNRVIILFIYFIIVTFPLISMLREKLVELPDHTVILFFHMTFLHSLILKPVIIPEKALGCHPVLWQPVPCNNLLIFHIRAPDLTGKFLQPFTLCSCSSHLFQGRSRSILRSSKGGYIESFYI